MAKPDVGIHATETRAFARPAAVGQVADNRPSNRFGDVINQDPQAPKIYEFTVTGAALLYAITAGGVDFSLAGSVASVAAATNELADSMNEDPVFRSWFEAVSDGVDKVTITGQLPGQDVDVSESDSNLTLALIQSPASAAVVEFGRAVLALGFATPANATLDPDGTVMRGAKVAAAKYTAQADVWTVADPGTGQVLVARVKVPGLGEIVVQVPTTGTIDTDLDSLEAAADAALADAGLGSYVDASGPTDSGNTGEIAFNALIAGVELESFVGCDDAAGYPAISLASNLSTSTSILRSLAGISVRATDEVPSQVGATSSSYGANRGVRLLEDGRMWVESAEAIAWRDRVYIGTASGEEGKFYKAAAAGRIPLPFEVARWERKARSGEGDDLAILEIHAPA